jgi:biotin synthase
MNPISLQKELHAASDARLQQILSTDELDHALFQAADQVRQQHYGKKVYLRGLIEFSNFCRNNCFYCGIRKDNPKIKRYRLTKEQILACCKEGYSLGYRTFVLQSGEDPENTDAFLCDVVSQIRQQYPDCAITLSLGERTRESYQNLLQAGANRYLLRHETANPAHYRKLHPASMSLAHRKDCLFTLKELGYQVGAGFMVGSPYQTLSCLVEDLRFLQQLEPAMIGIGPYLTHKDTPFSRFPNGSLSLTLRLIAILRLLFPKALIPATTALGTIHPQGREMGLKAGANVVMPNLSPVSVRKLYSLYEDKICTGEESAQCRGCLERRVASAGYTVVTDIGNPVNFSE